MISTNMFAIYLLYGKVSLYLLLCIMSHTFWIEDTLPALNDNMKALDNFHLPSGFLDAVSTPGFPMLSDVLEAAHCYMIKVPLSAVQPHHLLPRSCSNEVERLALDFKAAPVFHLLNQPMLLLPSHANVLPGFKTRELKVFSMIPPSCSFTILNRRLEYDALYRWKNNVCVADVDTIGIVVNPGMQLLNFTFGY
jgi:hypothetical protein